MSQPSEPVAVLRAASYEVRGRGGLYPEGCSFSTTTANGAIERYLAVRAACGRATVFDAEGHRLSAVKLRRQAADELTDTE